MQGLRFVVGRLELRLFRQPALRGWTGAEERADGQGPPYRTAPASVPTTSAGRFRLKKLPDGGLRLAVPGADVVTLSTEAARAMSASGRVSLLVAWPATLCLVRVNRVLTFAEGDLFRFGEVVLDPQRVLRQVGFEYLSDTGAEVEPHIELEERSSIDPDRAMKRLGFDGGTRAEAAARTLATVTPASVDTIRLRPGQSTRFGPYELVNERSFDHSRRTGGGVATRGYFFRLRRLGEEPLEYRATGGLDGALPDPFAVTAPEELLALARARGLVGEDEALLGETQALAELKARYEGPTALLDRELAELGPAPELRFHGDALAVTVPRVFRDPSGTPALGRATVLLPQIGPPRITRTDLERTLPGRISPRRPGTGTGAGTP